MFEVKHSLMSHLAVLLQPGLFFCHAIFGNVFLHAVESSWCRFIALLLLGCRGASCTTQALRPNPTELLMLSLSILSESEIDSKTESEIEIDN